jgi:hypothetical protein
LFSSVTRNRTNGYCATVQETWKNGVEDRLKENPTMDQVKHIGSSFDAALYGLRNDVLMMSSLTDRLFHSAFEALWNRDSGNRLKKAWPV